MVAASRLKKVKQSTHGGEQSRAIGKYFFFCAKQKDDSTKCRFARPVEDEITPKKQRLCTFFAKHKSCKKGNKCMFSHDVESFLPDASVKTTPKNETSTTDDTAEQIEGTTSKSNEAE